MKRRMMSAVLFVFCVTLTAPGSFAAAAAGTDAAVQPDQAKQQAQAAGQVSQADAFLLRPDLAVDRIWIVKAGPAVLSRPPLPVTQLKKGEKYLLYCRYVNKGSALNGVWKLGYFIDGEMVWNQYWGNVAAGATKTEHNPGFVPTTLGQHTYQCRLDFDSEVAERDESNNKAKIAFTVVP